MFNLDRLEAPTPISTFVAQSQIVILSCLCVCLAGVMVSFEGLTLNHTESDKSLSRVFVPVVITILCLIGNYTTIQFSQSYTFKSLPNVFYTLCLQLLNVLCILF